MRPVEELEENRIHEPEVVNDTALVRSPRTPTTVDELAALQHEGEEIVEARVKILQTLRAASIRATSPEDWLLFRAKDGRETAYLSDAGCQRVRPLWGINITPLGDFEKIDVGDDFAYLIKGDAECLITGQILRGIEGLRYSTDDFCKDLTPIMKAMRVRQGARANLDGNCTRKLTGLSVVAVVELAETWKGTTKTVDRCVRGRGYGTQAQREGVAGSEAPKIKPPICDKCGKDTKYWAQSQDGKMPAVWRCADYKWDQEKRVGNGHSRILAADWEKAMATAQPAQPAPTGRQPGEEG